MTASECLSGVKGHRWLFGSLSEGGVNLLTSFHWFASFPLISQTMSCQSALFGLHIQALSEVKTSVAQTESNTQHKDSWLTTRQTWQRLDAAASLLTAALSACCPRSSLSAVFLKVCVIMDVLMGRPVMGGAVFGSGWNDAIHSASHSFLASSLMLLQNGRLLNTEASSPCVNLTRRRNASSLNERCLIK